MLTAAPQSDVPAEVEAARDVAACVEGNPEPAPVAEDLIDPERPWLGKLPNDRQRPRLTRAVIRGLIELADNVFCPAMEYTLSPEGWFERHPEASRALAWIYRTKIHAEKLGGVLDPRYRKPVRAEPPHLNERALALTVACPRCKAAPNTACVDSAGIPQDQSHRSRLKEAKKNAASSAV